MKQSQLAFLALLLFAVPARADTDLMPSTSRSLHDFNMRFFASLEPLVLEYREVKIEPVHKGMVNALANLGEPQTVINSLLVLDITNTLTALGRFVINTTVGLLGTIDVAKEIGLKRDKRDFGGTMGVWGIGAGSTFVMPLLGPTNVRDFTGMIVDSIVNPMNYFVLSYPVGVALSLSGASYGIYEGYDFIMITHENAVDSYTAFQTMFAQNRYEQIRRIRLGIRGPEREAARKYDFDFDMEHEEPEEHEDENSNTE